MKKRTKKKIHNRIIKKLISGQPLSGFDKKYHEEMVRKVYVTKPKVHLYADDKLVSTIDEVSHVSEEVITLDESTDFSSQSSSSAFEWINREEHLIIDLSADSTLTISEAMKLLMFDNLETKPPTKWQKIISKVKGWFAK